jgi:hypothetical protein
MSTVRCPHCDAPFPSEEVIVGKCQHCGKELMGGRSAGEGIMEADAIPATKERVDSQFERPRRSDVRRREGTSGGCPECGSHYLRAGPWPWYLGTIGAMLCRAVICGDCGHEFDANKPQANLATRKRNLAIAINGVGLLGIIGVIGGLVLWIWWFSTHR